jgi:hypothetical protein
MAEITIWKDGRLIAEAPRCAPTLLPGEKGWEGITNLQCYYFSKINLSPPILFEHLAGSALTKYLDRADLHLPAEEPIQKLRYVHGRSEAMKGRCKVGAVLLAAPLPEGGVTELAWMTYLPDIYKRFMAVHRG